MRRERMQPSFVGHQLLCVCLWDYTRKAGRWYNDCLMTEKVTVNCTLCQIGYPKELLDCLYTSEGDFTDICGICALEATNRIHGLQLRRFTGVIAEAKRKAAIGWRARLSAKK